MATEAHRQLSCVGKIRYALAADAHKAMRHVVRRKGTRPNEVVEVYACEYCDGWHFGHAPSKGKK